jgi:hypothetical protein
MEGKRPRIHDQPHDALGDQEHAGDGGRPRRRESANDTRASMPYIQDSTDPPAAINEEKSRIGTSQMGNLR